MKKKKTTVFNTSPKDILARGGYYLTIPGNIIDDPNISDTAVRILLKLLKGSKTYEMTVKGTTRWMGSKSENKFRKYFKELIALGYMRKVENGTYQVTDTPHNWVSQNRGSKIEDSQSSGAKLAYNDINNSSIDNNLKNETALNAQEKVDQQSNPSKEGIRKTPKNGDFSTPLNINTEEPTSSKDNSNDNSNIMEYNIGRLDMDIPLEITQENAYIKLKQYQECYRNMVDCKSRKPSKKPDSRLDPDVFNEQVWPLIQNNPKEFFYVMEAFTLYIKEAGVYIFKDKYHAKRVRERFIEEEFPEPFNILAGMYYAGNLASTNGFNKTAGKKLKRALKALHKGEFDRIAKGPLEKYVSVGMKELQRVRNITPPPPPLTTN